MSAFVVSKSTIDLLVAVVVNEAERSRFRGVSAEDPDALGRMLWEENRKSVNARYYASPPEPELVYKWKQPKGPLNPVVVLKQIACYEYQACEHDGWEESPARKLCDELRDRMIFALPGFEAAPWGLP